MSRRDVWVQLDALFQIPGAFHNNILRLFLPDGLAELEQFHRRQILLFLHQCFFQNIPVDGSVVASNVRCNHSCRLIDKIPLSLDIVFP